MDEKRTMEQDKENMPDKEALMREIEELREALLAERALDRVYEARLRTVEEIRGMKFASAYRSLSAKLGKGDPFDAVRRPLKNHERIHLWIGSRIYGREEMIVRGWTVDPYSEAEYLRVRDREGRRVDARIRRCSRPDVNRTFRIAEERQTGFVIRIPASCAGRLPMTLEVESASGILKAPLHLFPEREKRIARWQRMLDGVEAADEGPLIEYDDWAGMNRAGEEELALERTEIFPWEPLISVVVPLYLTPRGYLREMTDSILSQTYRNIELCLADGSPDDSLGTFLMEMYGEDERILYRHLPENYGISGNTNAAIELASGDFIMLTDHDDVVEPNAVYEIVKAINQSPVDTDLIYTDEDKLEQDGGYLFDPFFKPGYDQDLLESYNYFTHIVVIRRETLEKAGPFRPEFDGAQDYDFLLRCAEQARRIEHVPKALYHWRAHEQSTAGNPESKLYAYERGRLALMEHMTRCGIRAEVEMTPYWGRYRTSYYLEMQPLLTVLTFSRGPSLKGRIPEIGYENTEVIPIPRSEKSLASSLMRGAEIAGGEYLLFLNEDAEFRDLSAFAGMFGLMRRNDVGCVGTKVVSEAGRIFSAGYVLGIAGLAAPAFADVSAEVFTYGGFANLTRGVSGVSLDAMLVRKDAFFAAGGFDEAYEEALFDLDLCLALRSAGYKTVMDPYAEITLKGDVRETRFVPERMGTDEDRMHFQRKWHREIQEGDPFYNRNLTRTRADYSLKDQYRQDTAL